MRGELLHARRVLPRLLRRAGHEVGHQLERIRRRLGHLIVEDVRGPVRIAEELRLRGADPGDADDDAARVVRAAVAAAVLRRGQEALAQLAVLQRGELRLLGGVAHDQDPLPFHPALLGRLGGRGDVGVAHAGEHRLVIDDDRRGVRVGEDVVVELGVELRLLLVQRAQLRLVRLGEERAGADEVAVVALQEVLRLGVEAARLPRVVQRLHAREELRVEVDGVVVRGELRRFLPFELLQRVVRVRLRQREEDLRGAGEEIAAALHRLDGVGEGRGVGAARDRVDLRELPLHPFLEGRLVVGVLDLVELRGIERQRARREEGVGLRRRGAGHGQNE